MIRAVLICALLAAGCVSLTPQQEAARADTRAFLERAARVYHVRAPALVVGDQTADLAASYRNGVILVGTSLLSSRARDAVLAHEFAHYLLGHEAPLRAVDRVGQGNEQYQRELAANVKSVEVLARMNGGDEGQALRVVYSKFLWQRRGEQAGRPIPWGHRSACQEAADVVAAFPIQSAALSECR